MTYLAGLPAHPLVVHAAVVLIPMIALLIAAAPFVAPLRQKYSLHLVVAGAVAVVIGLIASNTGESFEHALAEENAMLEQHAELGDSISIFTVATLAAAALIWWSQRAAASGKDLGKAVTTTIAAFAVLVGVATTAQIVRIGHSGAKTVWCEDSPSCSAGQSE